jgi:phosphate transport system permease protein
MNKKNPYFFNYKESAFRYLLISCSLVIVAFFLALFYMLISQSLPAISSNGFGSIFGNIWDSNNGIFGGLPAILGTLASSLIATVLAIPISLGIAIFFTEYAPARIRFILSIFIDLLAAIPSVIYGIWGLWVIAPLIKSGIQQPIINAFGFIPFFSGPAYGLSIFMASMILTIMVIPIVSSISIDLLASTPLSLKEGMISLGATKWETMRHVGIPFAKIGILGAVILGLGRALGETMAVTMVIGNSYSWPFASVSIFSPATTITSKIASELYEATSATHVASLIELALVLLIITLAINSVARLIINRATRRGYTQ